MDAEAGERGDRPAEQVRHPVTPRRALRADACAPGSTFGVWQRRWRSSSHRSNRRELSPLAKRLVTAHAAAALVGPCDRRHEERGEEQRR